MTTNELNYSLLAIGTVVEVVLPGTPVCEMTLADKHLMGDKLHATLEKGGNFLTVGVGVVLGKMTLNSNSVTVMPRLICT